MLPCPLSACPDRCLLVVPHMRLWLGRCCEWCAHVQCRRELFSESEAAGKRCAFLQQDPSKWIKLVQEVQDLVQASQEQSTVAIVYKDGVESDIARLASHTEARAGVDVPTQQQLSAAVATLAQAQAKLKSLRVGVADVCYVGGAGECSPPTLPCTGGRQCHVGHATPGTSSSGAPASSTRGCVQRQTA